MIPDLVHEGGFAVSESRLGPWPKACETCALRNNDPQQLGGDAQDDLKALIAAGQLVFFCLHRRDTTGKHRVCGCAAAIAKAAMPSA